MRVENGWIESCSYNFSIKDIIIPDSLDGQVVIGIGKYKMNSTVFSWKGITDIQLPPTIQYIGPEVFSGNSLTEVDFSICRDLRSIGTGAFSANELLILDLDSCTELRVIGRSAFSENHISDISFPEDLEIIGAVAFWLNGLSRISLPSGLKSIGAQAFHSNELTEVNLTSCSNLLAIESSAFSENAPLPYITLPVHAAYSTLGWKDGKKQSYMGGDQVSDFGTFYYVPRPYTLTDGDVLVEDGLITSYSPNMIQRIIVIPDTLDGQVIRGIADGELKNLNSSGVFSHQSITSLELPSELEYIGNVAFSKNELDRVDFTKCVALYSIGKMAFSDNTLQSLDVGHCDSLLTIGESAFSSNELSTITLPATLEWIRRFAFSSNKLTVIDLSPCTSLIAIGAGALQGNEFLPGFQLPYHTLHGESGWKDGNGSLFAAGEFVSDLTTRYAVAVPYTLQDDDVEVLDGVIQSCSYQFAIRDIMIPDILDGQEVIGIAYNYSAGFAKRELTGLQLPSTIQFLEYSTFSNNLLTNVDFSSCPVLARIGSNAFFRNKLKTLDLSGCSSLTEIGERAYYSNEISEVDFPESVQIIGNNAFERNQLSGISLPSGLRSIGKSAFNTNELGEVDLSSCSNLLAIESHAFSENNALSGINLPVHSEFGAYGWRDGNDEAYVGGDAVNDFEIYYYVPAPYKLTDEDVEVLDGMINSYTPDMTHRLIIIPDTLDGQEVRGFADGEIDSFGEAGVFIGKELESVELPASLEYIGDVAFAGNNLDSLDLSICAELHSIGEDAFKSNRLQALDLSSCDSLVRIGYFAFSYNELADISFPSRIELILPGAFYANKLSEVDFSPCSTLIHIGAIAFTENDSLDGFQLPFHAIYSDYGWKDKNDRLYAAGDYVTNLATAYTIHAPYTLTDADVEVVDGEILSCSYPHSDYLTEVVIPDTLDGQAVMAIGTKVFAHEVLTDVSLPAGLERVGAQAFTSNNLERLDLSSCDSLRFIEPYAFYGNRIEDLLLPVSLELIGDGAFKNNELTEIELSTCNSLTYIGEYAFEGNEFLTQMVLPAHHLFQEEGWKDWFGQALEGGDTVSVTSNYYYVPVSYTLNDEDVDVSDGLITRCQSYLPLKLIVIPDTLDGQEVRGILDAGTEVPGVFETKSLVGVVFPSSIETIGDRSFYGNHLQSIDLSRCVELTSIGIVAFMSNDLPDMDLRVCRSLIQIGRQAFDINYPAPGQRLDTIILPRPEVPGFDYEHWMDNMGKIYLAETEVQYNGNILTAVMTSILNVVFTVTDGIVILPGASVTLGAYDPMETDSAGQVIFAEVLPGDSISYTVTAEGYHPFFGTVSVSDTSVYVSVELSLITYTVTIIVTDGMDPLAGAEVELAAYGTVTTNQEGVALFPSLIPWTQLNFSITASGYESSVFSITLHDNDIQMSISLSPSTGISDTDKDSFKIYPNPAKDLIHMELPGTSTVHIRDMCGRIVLEKKYPGGTVSLDVTSMFPGLYVLQIVGIEHRISKRIVIDK